MNSTAIGKTSANCNKMLVKLLNTKIAEIVAQEQKLKEEVNRIITEISNEQSAVEE